MSIPDSQLAELGENPTAAEAAAVLRRLANVSVPPCPVPGDVIDDDSTGTVETAAPREHLANVTERWSDATFRNLLESLPDAVVIIDRDGTIVVVNQQTEDLFEYGRGELIGQPVERLVPRRFRFNHVAQRDEFIADPHVRPMGAERALWGARKDGSEVPVEISLSPLRTETGLHVIASIRDVTEKKRLVARYRTLVEEIPAVTFMASFDGGVNELYVSPQIENLLGFTQKEWLENPVLWYAQLHEDDRERWHTEFARTCASAEPFRSVYRFIARDGRVVWVHGEARVVRDADGHPVFLQGVAFDITEQQEAAELLEHRVAERTAALAESEERTRMIVENALDAVITMDSAGVITGWNSQAEKTFGWSHDEVLGRRVGETIIPPGYRDAHNRGLEHFLTSGRGPLLGKRIEITALRKDGTEFPVALAISAVRSGGAFTFSAFVSDISERRRALELIQASEHKYRALVEKTTTGYLITDEEGRVVDANTEYARLTGHLTRGDILGRNVAEWIDPGDQVRARQQMRECLLHGEVRNLEINYVSRDGEPLPVEINAAVLETDEGKRIVSLCRDITERRREEGQSIHDLRRDVRNSRRSAQLMQRNPEDSLLPEIIDRLYNVLVYIDAMETHAEVGREGTIETFDCNVLLAELVRAHLADPRNEITIDPLPTLTTNPMALRRVFDNLIENALKYRNEDVPARIHVSARRAGDEWEFSVRDNGIGIPDESLERIFEFGERIKELEDVEGTGIGLATVKKAVERSGGRIWVDSQLGQGSTFYFTLPAT